MSTFTLQELIDDIEKAEERHAPAPVADEDFVDCPHDVLLTVCTSCHRAALAAEREQGRREGMERAAKIADDMSTAVAWGIRTALAAEPDHAEPKEGG